MLSTIRIKEEKNKHTINHFNVHLLLPSGTHIKPRAKYNTRKIKSSLFIIKTKKQTKIKKIAVAICTSTCMYTKI